MSTFKLIHGSCADKTADALVNTANSGLWEGGGICGVIFSKCGSKELAQECSKYQTPIKDGNAVITSACNMKNAKYIIHAVGPDFRQTPKAFLELFNAYYNSLVLLKVSEFWVKMSQNTVIYSSVASPLGRVLPR
jgi:O-acetyl-ADP-ribose deacetylase (regulator of RNase III)